MVLVEGSRALVPVDTAEHGQLVLVRLLAPVIVVERGGTGVLPLDRLGKQMRAISLLLMMMVMMMLCLLLVQVEVHLLRLGGLLLMVRVLLHLVLQPRRQMHLI